MTRQAASFLFAICVMAVFLVGMAWALRSETDGASASLAKRTLGPTNEAFVFKAVVKGSDGPLRQCVVCHSVEKGAEYRVAPSLWGIVDAPKARARWFGYSQALARAEGSWTEEHLDKYLTKPSRYLPGTKKTLVGIPDQKNRAAIITELKKLSD